MKTRTCTTRKLIAGATAGVILLTGCFNDPASGDSAQGGGNATATVEGRVTGEIALAKRASAGIEGATVTLVRLKDDGSFETVSESEARTDAEGRFSIRTAAEAAHGLLVIARKEGREYKAVISGEVKQGAKTASRPLDVESTVEAEVYAKVKGDGKPDEVCFADIASHIDARMAARAEGKSEVRDHMASQIETEAETRVKVLMGGTAKATRAQIEKMDEARLEAQAALEASLDAASRTEAGITAEARMKAEGEAMKAQWAAVAGAGIALGEFAQAREAAFRAMMKAYSEAQVESEAEAKAEWLRRAALVNALSLQAAIEEDAKSTGGSADLAVEAGATLKLSLESAETGAEVDSAFAAFRASVASGLKTSLQAALGGAIELSDSSEARSALEISLENAADAEAVAEAYAKFYADAEAEIRAGIAGSGGSIDETKVEALTRMALLIDLKGRIGGGTQGGFTLNGSVEGGLSGAEVRIATVKADGTLEVMAEVKAETGANGEFTLETDKALPENVVLVVTKDSATLKTLVDTQSETEVKVGSETTVEAEVYQKVVGEGKVDITPADVKAQVDSVTAATLKGDDTLMVSLVASMDAAAKAQARFLTDSGVGLAQASLLLITTARATAQTRLEAELKAASGDAVKVKAAYDAYHNALMEAYIKAGLDVSAYARSQQVYAQALVKSAVRFSGEAKAALIRSGHSQAARGLRSAVELHMKAAGASETLLKAASEAGVALQSAIDISASAETIAAAYDSYHASIVSCLRGVFVLHAAALSEIDGRIRGEGGARASLMAALRADASAEALTKAHVEFASRVEAEVTSEFEGGLGGPTDAQVKVMSQILLLANMCG
jgi:hypothetical protein